MRAVLARCEALLTWGEGSSENGGDEREMWSASQKIVHIKRCQNGSAERKATVFLLCFHANKKTLYFRAETVRSKQLAFVDGGHSIPEQLVNFPTDKNMGGKLLCVADFRSVLRSLRKCLPWRVFLMRCVELLNLYERCQTRAVRSIAPPSALWRFHSRASRGR